MGKMMLNNSDYNKKYSILDGVGYEYKFDNGYGASVVSHSGSYGGNQGLYELAVLDSTGDLCYSTPITEDVIGHLTSDKVVELLERIKSL